MKKRKRSSRSNKQRPYWIFLLLLAAFVGAIFYLKQQPEEPEKKVSIPEVKKVLPPKKVAPAKKVLPPKVLPPKISNKVAIVLDDWGYNTNNIELLDSIDIPLTLAVLPNLPYSYTIAQSQSKRKDREIILHMPMQPEDSTVRLEKNTLLISMENKEVVDIFNTALRNVPYALGVSNHMGSEATRNPRLIKTIMEQLKLKGLYFSDSLAIADSICEEEARKAKVRFIKRDIFLDNMADENYISSQIAKLMAVALSKGYSVGVGHDREHTLKVLKKVSDNPPGDIEFVLLSELVDK